MIFAWHEDENELDGGIYLLDDDIAEGWVMFDSGALG